jgi:endonuclease/exonuclease/phosphatase family metal-dependent hydrolase
MNWLLDLEVNKGKYQEFRIEFEKTYTDVFPTEDKEFRYDGIGMYINTRVFKDFEFIKHERKDLDTYRTVHRFGLKSKKSGNELWITNVHFRAFMDETNTAIRKKDIQDTIKWSDNLLNERKGATLVVMGDYNMPIHEDTYKLFVDD